MKTFRINAAHSAVLLLTLASASTTALAHGSAGNRVFPATLVVEDPAVADELTLPVISRFNDGHEGFGTETEAEWAKRITDNFGLSVEGGYVDGKEADGFENISLGAKYQFYKNDEHEFITSLGLGWEIGGTSSNDVGEDFSTLTPTFYFGKGMGDLGDGLSYLRPLALTGAVGVAFPTDRYTDDEKNAKTLEWGFTLQYSLPYLQQHVKDLGLGETLGNVTPVIEFAMETPFDQGDHHHGTTGTINPGLIWSNESFQLGAQAILPANGDSGDGVGARVQLHFYLDDLFPNSLGKPIW